MKPDRAALHRDPRGVPLTRAFVAGQTAFLRAHRMPDGARNAGETAAS